MELQSAHEAGNHQDQACDGERHGEGSAWRGIRGKSSIQDIYAVSAIGTVASRTAICLADAERVQKEEAGLAAEADIRTRAGIASIARASSALSIQYKSACCRTGSDALSVVEKTSACAARTVRKRETRRTATLALRASTLRYEHASGTIGNALRTVKHGWTGATSASGGSVDAASASGAAPHASLQDEVDEEIGGVAGSCAGLRGVDEVSVGVAGNADVGSA